MPVPNRATAERCARRASRSAWFGLTAGLALAFVVLRGAAVFGAFGALLFVLLPIGLGVIFATIAGRMCGARRRAFGADVDADLRRSIRFGFAAPLILIVLVSTAGFIARHRNHERFQRLRFDNAARLVVQQRLVEWLGAVTQPEADAEALLEVFDLRDLESADATRRIALLEWARWFAAPAAAYTLDEIAMVTEIGLALASIARVERGLPTERRNVQLHRGSDGRWFVSVPDELR